VFDNHLLMLSYQFLMHQSGSASTRKLYAQRNTK